MKFNSNTIKKARQVFVDENLYKKELFNIYNYKTTTSRNVLEKYVDKPLLDLCTLGDNAVFNLLNREDLNSYLSDYLASDEIPYFFPIEYSNSLLSLEFRLYYIQYRGYILLNHLLINDLVYFINGRKVLEIMAGTGYLSHQLKLRGVDIIATDNMSWNDKWKIQKDVENIDAIEAINKYKDRDIIIMSWAYMDDTAYRCLQEMRKVNKNAIMICIGESQGGATCDDMFFDNIKEIDIDINLNRYLQQCRGIHDEIIVVK